jgi:hypothetical protein
MTSTVAPSTTIIPCESIKNGESIKNVDSAVTSAYRTRKSFAVVHFEEAGKGLIAFLPEGAEVRVIGPSSIGKCLEILFENRRYNIFKADLWGPWAVQVDPILVRPGRVKQMRALAAGVACA